VIVIKTEILKPDSNGISKAADILKNGGLCAIPTETVYGLAANALNSKAVENIFKAKNRPQDNPLIVHITEFDEIYPLVKSVCQKAKKLTDAYWPGPLTIILPKSDIVPSVVSRGLDTVAIRMPSHPVARDIIKAAGVPLAAPSANRSGRPSPTTAAHVFEDMDGIIEAIVDGGTCYFGLESTVISFISDTPRLLRPGAVTPEDIEKVIGKIDIDPAVTEKLKDDAKVASPGMKHKHYSPKANVIILNGELEKFCDYIKSHPSKGCLALCFEGEENKLSIPAITYGKIDSPLSQAQELFAALHSIDSMKNVKTVYARCPQTEGVGLAVYNRLIRAAGFEVIEL